MSPLSHARYSREEERRLREDLDAGRPPVCPRCETPLEARPVPPQAGVPYVRRRIWYVCGACGGSLVVDRSRRPRE